MRRISVHIEELGPIRNANIELAQLMLFTGASNLGKSYTNFLAYYVFSAFANNRIYKFISNKIDGRLKQNANFDFVLKLSDLCVWMSEDVKDFFKNLLGYNSIPCTVFFDFDTDVDAFDISFLREDDSFKFKDDDLKVSSVTINGAKRLMIWDDTIASPMVSDLIASHLSVFLFGTHIAHSFLLPPGRASLLDNSYSVQKSASRVGMYDLFLRDYDILTRKSMNEISKDADRQFFESRISKLIGGKVKATKDGTVLILSDGSPIPLSAAASSIKELSPILFWMQNREISLDSICIEEPEAHAHPEMQYGIADLLVACLNKGAFMQITTHSDYLLSRLNQLILLHHLKTSNEAAFMAYCTQYRHSSKLTLDVNNVKAYYFYRDENNEVKIRLQDISDGIPFDSFSSIVKRQIEIDDLLEESLKTENNG